MRSTKYNDSFLLAWVAVEMISKRVIWLEMILLFIYFFVFGDDADCHYIQARQAHAYLFDIHHFFSLQGFQVVIKIGASVGRKSGEISLDTSLKGILKLQKIAFLVRIVFVIDAISILPPFWSDCTHKRLHPQLIQAKTLSELIDSNF